MCSVCYIQISFPQDQMKPKRAPKNPMKNEITKTITGNRIAPMIRIGASRIVMMRRTGMIIGASNKRIGKSNKRMGAKRRPKIVPPASININLLYNKSY